MGCALNRVLDKIDAKKSGSGWVAKCPAHDDRSPSLSIAEKNEMVLLNCHAGCHVQDVMVALGLDWPDLFDRPIESDRGHMVASWTYQHRDGTPYLTVERWQNNKGKRFIQRLPNAERAGLPAGFKPCLYKMPSVLTAVDRGEEVWVVEGEKCVSAAERLGLVATTGPGGAGKWKEYYSQWLVGAKCVNIVCDNDVAGREHAAGVAVSLRGCGVPVKTWKIKADDPKADLYDHVLAGYGVEDLVPIKLNRLRPNGTTYQTLMSTDFPPITWAIDGVLPAGLAILGGPPKQMKSMIALDMALGVACGGRALSELTCQEGSVLYLALDNDSNRRLRQRAEYLMSDGTKRIGCLPIEFHTEWPTGDPAIRACQEWVDDEREAVRTPLLIVVDTLGKIEPNFEGGAGDNAYLSSTSNLSKWAALANDNDVAVLAIHHDRKSNDDDWMNRFTGSRGITATASTLMMIEATRGEPTGHLRISGRDLECDDLELHRLGWTWVTHDRPVIPNLRVVE